MLDERTTGAWIERKTVPGSDQAELVVTRITRIPLTQGDRAWIFAEGFTMPELAKAKESVSQFASIIGAETTLYGGWKLTFGYRQHAFEIDYQGCANGWGDSAYFVDDPTCPDEILLEVTKLLHDRFPGDDPVPDSKEFGGQFVVAVIIGVIVAVALVVVLFVFGKPK